MINGEVHLFILWSSARYLEEKILEDIQKNFLVLQMMNIQWDKEYFTHNLSKFYGKKLPSRSEKARVVGNDEFLLILVLDKSPLYAVRRTHTGREMVNVNMFDSKEMYRYWLQNHNIHSSNTIEEVDHDLKLLLGISYEDVLYEFRNGNMLKNYRKVL